MSRAMRVVRGKWMSGNLLRRSSASETIQIASNRVKAAAFREWHRRENQERNYHPGVDISRLLRECDGA
jgi:hypothetical protein